MRCEILTSTMDKSRMKEELAYLVQYFHNLSQSTCEIVLGTWGVYYDLAVTLDYEMFPVVNLCGLVEELEESDCGRLGSDDLYVKFPDLGLEFRFCNDSDIHLDYAQPNQHTEAFFERWRSQGYSPVKWPKNSEERG